MAGIRTSRIIEHIAVILVLLLLGWLAGFKAYSAYNNDDLLVGRVVGVIDGDTLDVLTPQKEKTRIRLAGIDAPEKSQPFGQKSKQMLSQLAYNCTASIKVIGHDRYGRVIGYVHACGNEVNETMIRQGMAWVYRDYALPDVKEDWLKLEEEARKQRRGLWRDENPTPPWVWRKQQRKAHDAHSEL